MNHDEADAQDQGFGRLGKYEEAVTAAYGALFDTITDESEYPEAVAAVGMHAMLLISVRGGVDMAKSYAQLLSKMADAPEFAVGTLIARAGIQQPA